jgi:pyrroline-5-carboxylate reductase
MPRDMASKLVLQTMLGSIRLAQTSPKHVAELRNMVTSPGGTTAAGLLQLEKSGLRAILAQAVVAAYDKAQELGKEPK